MIEGIGASRPELISDLSPSDLFNMITFTIKIETIENKTSVSVEVNSKLETGHEIVLGNFTSLKLHELLSFLRVQQELCETSGMKWDGRVRNLTEENTTDNITT